MRALAVLAFLVPSLVSTASHADVQHTVGKGHTIDAIATRYHVTAKSIIEANHLKNPKALRVGEVLTIPGVKDTKAAKPSEKDAKNEPRAKAEKVSMVKPVEKPAEKKPETKAEKKERDKADKKAEATNFAMKAKTPGVLHLHRLATNDDLEVRVSDRKNKVSSATLKSFEKLMKSPGGQAHPIEPRLISLLSVVSNHFGSRKIEVVSGFRPFTPTQHNPHSNHMHGKAIDFRVVGVPNETLRDFCRTLKNVGCGYYPNSVFVHMDVRETSAFWIDYSKPGEAPRYNSPGVDADEGTTDVHDEQHPATGATPDEAKPSDNTKPADAPKPSDAPALDAKPVETAKPVDVTPK